MKLFYLPLEAYRERYTELLTNWTERRFSGVDGVDLHVVRGTKLETEGIATGRVLDAHGRCHWSATQIARLVALLRTEGATSRDAIYLDDMFTPGYEALPYIFDQLAPVERPRIIARNHAQSVDPDDFVFPMRHWMRRFEELVYRTASGILCGSTVHKEMMEAACLDQCPIHVVGLPYDADDVRSRAPKVIAPPMERARNVLFSSRFDAEKQPHFFMDVLENVLARRRVTFQVCTGGARLRSNDQTALDRLRSLEGAGKVEVHEGIDKTRYYQLLAEARVQLNTARQDFISYTAIEASTLGTPTLAPAFRSFPETLRNRARVLYAPWSVEDAADKLIRLVDEGDDPAETAILSAQQHGTLDRILEVLRGGR